MAALTLQTMRIVPCQETITSNNTHRFDRKGGAESFPLQLQLLYGLSSTLVLWAGGEGADTLASAPSIKRRATAELVREGRILI